MTEIGISFKSVEEIQHYLTAIEEFDIPMDVRCGSVSVDARSIMGIMSLGLNKVITLMVNSDHSEKVKCAIAKYVVE